MNYNTEEKASGSYYDVVIIGGGINGAGIAQAACAAGYSALVLEKNDGVARETSSRSSKLIHGGLRYLESADFRLVHECLRERRLLLKNAPGLVRLVPFHIPVYRETSRSSLKIMAGLCLYSLLSKTRFKKLSRRDWRSIDGLDTKDLKSVFVYYDAQTNDAILTRAVMQSACSLGTRLLTNAKFISASIKDEHVEVDYQHSGISSKYTCRALINASGPWINNVHANILPGIRPLAVDLVSGAHILLPDSLESGLYYLEAPVDRRAVFAMPWHGQTLVGTTETIHTGDPTGARVLETEKQYLLDVYNHYFMKNRTPDDIINSFAGLRVLPGNNGKVFKRTRDVRLLIDNNELPRYVAVYGGKLTSYRATAESVMQKLRLTLPLKSNRIDTKQLHLIFS